MAQKVDPYSMLQVVPTADADVIRAAYRALARRYHPDHSTDADDARRMVELNAAWELVGDPVRRAAYDLAIVPEAAKEAGDRERPAQDGNAQEPAGTRGRRGETAAGDPPGRPSGSVLDFGRYSGWSLGQIARADRNYLEWFKRTTFGRRFEMEIEALLQPVGAAPTPPQPYKTQPRRRTWLGRRG